jgi:hypothetical protein
MGGENGEKNIMENLHEIILEDSPAGSIPKLSILHGFQMFPGKAPISFETFGREKPAQFTSKHCKCASEIAHPNLVI